MFGGQGIAFNQNTNLVRSAFGYPITDPRWPAYTWNGEDLAYCQGSSVYDSAGHVRIPCTMTGGASGGAWLSFVASNWLGYVNSVEQPQGLGRRLHGQTCYFGAVEQNVWNYWTTQ